MMLSIILLFTLLYTESIETRFAKPLTGLVPSEDYTHSQVVDHDNPEQFQVFWKLLGNEEILFEAHCKTSGWVGVGISRTGGMAGADIAIGWVRDGKPYLKDCYATGKSTPMTDPQQDYDLVEGAENNGYTILKFKRKLQTCDKEHDSEIKIGTQYMIFAWSSKDPETGNNDWQYHGENRIQHTTMLLTFKDETLEEQNTLPTDTFTQSFTVENLQVPANKETFYFCDIYKLPSFEKSVHMIQFEILVNKNTKQHFHHLLAYECDDDFEPTGPLAAECGSVKLPNYIYQKCFQKIIVAWGIGGQLNYTFPKQAGYRIDPHPTPKYILLEVHYDNPSLKPNIIDNSGVRLYFTEQLKPHDLGVLLLGNDGIPLSLQIPPRSNNFAFTSICYPDCTDKFFPEDGIYAFSAFLHTHLAGRSVKTTLVRDGLVIQDLFDNPNYDFNYQFLYDIEPVKLQKGDALITKCSFNTYDRSNFTFFGFSTHDEMCYDFIYYYPRLPQLTSCMTLSNTKAIFGFYRDLMKESIIPQFELKEELFKSGEELMEFFQTKVNSTPTLVKRFENFFASSYNKTIYCGNPFGEIIRKENVLHLKPKGSLIKEIDGCKNWARKFSPSGFISSITLFVSLLF